MSAHIFEVNDELDEPEELDWILDCSLFITPPQTPFEKQKLDFNKTVIILQRSFERLHAVHNLIIWCNTCSRVNERMFPFVQLHNSNGI